MKQSTRIRMYKEYHDHPLRKEYEANKRKVKKYKKSASDILGICVCIIPFILIFVFGYLFFGNVTIVKYSILFNWFLIIALGIGNIFLCMGSLWVFMEGTFKGCETKDFEALKEKYEQKGLTEVDDPYNAKCGEYDDYDEYFVCSANMQPLNNQERVWCSTAGNCKHCARFIRAMGFDPELHRNEIQKW